MARIVLFVATQDTFLQTYFQTILKAQNSEDKEHEWDTRLICFQFGAGSVAWFIMFTQPSKQCQ